MTILHLGVIDIPYSDKASISTGDVAEILESKYAVMENFAELHHDDIESALVDSIEGAIENIMSGSPVSNDMFGDATNKIEELFKFEFLEKEEMATIGVPGVPTQASIDRKSSRFKGKKTNTGRPSFIDTGEYSAAMKAWIEQ
jgi:hypothetical protein